MKKIFLISIVFLIISFNSTSAWVWLIPSNWDILNLSKWTELITELSLKLNKSDLKGWNNITLVNSWSEIIVNSIWWWSSTPYITSTLFEMWSSSTKSFTLNGYNFSPTSTISIPSFDWTIDSFTTVSPVRIDFSVTSGVSKTLYDILISNWGTLSSDWSWNWAWILSVWTVIWNWLAGTYTETFETNTLWNWIDTVWIDKPYDILNWPTGSTWTWPDVASGGVYYIYAETSTAWVAWSPTKTFAIETDNFRKAQNISFDYHMYWATIWTLTIETLNSWVRTNVYTITGEQQTANADAWINTWVIDLSLIDVEKIKIQYISWASYTWDASIDNIVINSI